MLRPLGGALFEERLLVFFKIVAVDLFDAVSVFFGGDDAVLNHCLNKLQV